MKIYVKILFVVFVFASLSSCSKNPEAVINEDTENKGLVVIIKDIRNDDGQIILDLIDENENKIDTIYQEIIDNTCEITIEGLAPGNYAFQYIHDENANNELDVNSLGIPKEGYGYSRNAPGTFGPPDIIEMVFEFNGSLEMECNIFYLF